VLERDIEDYLANRVRGMGGEIRKVQWIGRRGAPDRLVMLPEKNLGLAHATNSVWVELKAPGKKPRINQLREHERMRAMGQHVVVIDSLEGVDALLA